ANDAFNLSISTGCIVTCHILYAIICFLSLLRLQRAFRRQFGIDPPTYKIIH
ncbi:hypothetical protein L9F63_028010, partial [Diploptera punctata]